MYATPGRKLQPLSATELTALAVRLTKRFTLTGTSLREIAPNLFYDRDWTILYSCLFLLNLKNNRFPMMRTMAKHRKIGNFYLD